MPATRSQAARNIVEHVKSSPYEQALANAKGRHPVSIDKLERLLDREDTLPATELVDALLLAVTLAAEESLHEQSEAHTLHTIGDFLQRSLQKTPRLHQSSEKECPPLRPRVGGVASDTAEMARDCISSKAPKKAKDPMYMEVRYTHWKA
jgi:hypothetical protein